MSEEQEQEEEEGQGQGQEQEQGQEEQQEEAAPWVSRPLTGPVTGLVAGVLGAVLQAHAVPALAFTHRDGLYQRVVRDRGIAQARAELALHHLPAAATATAPRVS
jgi:hypothetical protein